MLSGPHEYQTASQAPAIERLLNDPSPPLPAPGAPASTEIDMYGDSQYSPYAEMEIIGDIDWVSDLSYILL